MSSVLTEGGPLPGEIVDGKYEVISVLGRGGMGVVVSANHLVLHEKVAIKTLIASLATDAQSIERFLREARALAKIQSSHVARVLDVTSLPSGSPCIVMEYLEGEDLDSLVEREGRIPFSRAVDYVLEACEAIAEAHALEIVHRDLKPSNLFLAKTRSGDSIKVLDFGISKFASGDPGELGLTRTKTILGSPLYMSPEQLRSARSVDARSDIWSLGAILFELIAGEPPFEAESIAELGALVLTTTARRLETLVRDVPTRLSDAIATCLERDPANRFANIAELAHTIAPFGGDASQASLARILRTVALPSVRTGSVKQISPDTLEATESDARLPASPSLASLQKSSGAAEDDRQRSKRNLGFAISQATVGETAERPRRTARAMIAMALVFGVGLVSLLAWLMLKGTGERATVHAGVSPSASASTTLAPSATAPSLVASGAPPPVVLSASALVASAPPVVASSKRPPSNVLKTPASAARPPSTTTPSAPSTAGSSRDPWDPR